MVNILSLVWDSWNVNHIARHGVTPDEAENVCHNNPLVQKGKKNRLLIIGLTKAGRMLTIILDPEDKEGHYYLVTARVASKREKRLYKQEKEVLENGKN